MLKIGDKVRIKHRSEVIQNTQSSKWSDSLADFVIVNISKSRERCTLKINEFMENAIPLYVNTDDLIPIIENPDTLKVLEEIEEQENSENKIKSYYKKKSQEIYISPRMIFILSQISNILRNMDILDVGCGNKFITNCMILYNNKVIGIDIEEDIADYMYKDKLFDAITCFDVFEHLQQNDFDKSLANIATLLKTKGYLVVNQPEQEDKTQPIDNLIDTMTIITKLKSLNIKLLKLEWYQVQINESYNFMVFQKVE